MYKTRKATYQDILCLSKKLREKDKKEIEAITSSKNYYHQLRLSFEFTEICYVVVDNDNLPIFIYGVDRDGCIWALGSDEVEKNKIKFVKTIKKDFEILKKQYKKLYNYVDNRNNTHILFLKYLGFSVLKEITVLKSGVKFYYFDWRK